MKKEYFICDKCKKKIKGDSYELYFVDDATGKRFKEPGCSDFCEKCINKLIRNKIIKKEDLL